MLRGTLATFATVVAMLLGCSSSSGPAPEPTSATVTDPSGDTFGSSGGPQWDLTAFTVTRDASSITVEFDFTNDVISPTTGDADAVLGFVDFDVDQNSTTGAGSAVDAFRHNTGSTGLGVDYELRLNSLQPDSTVFVIDSMGHLQGKVRPVYAGKKITVRIPKELIGDDDGFLNAAAVFGTVGRPTDIIPETGHLTLDSSGHVGAVRPPCDAAFDHDACGGGPADDLRDLGMPLRAPEHETRSARALWLALTAARARGVEELRR